METLVLCPEELCLGPIRLSPLLGICPNSANDFSIWTNETLEKGTRFLPWKGTVRSDKLNIFDKLSEFDIRNRFGLYDEITDVSPSRKLRQCNWIRFLRFSLVYNDAVNIIGAKGPTGEPVFELIKDLEPKSELICFFVPERPEEAFLLPAIQYLRHTLFKRLIDNALEESPLDLSTSLVSKVFPISPTNSDGGRKSVSSDCTTSTNNEEHHQHNGLVMPKPLHLPFAKMRSSPVHHALSVEALTAKTNNNNINKMKEPTSLMPTPNVSKPGRPQVVRRREKNMLPCNYCGKAFDRPSLLKRHIRIHTGERPHVCDICSKGFSTSSSLNTHRRIHSGEKPHQCGVCGKRFTASSNLYYHKMTHVKEKPHKCTMCSKSFPTPGDLKSHTYVHTGTWPFKCHICHRGFSKQTNLKNHLLLHSGDKPFSCEICHKKFALSCNLRAHLKTHETEFQNSQASLALYQRALAVLGSQQSSPKKEDEENELEDEEEMDEETKSNGEDIKSNSSSSPRNSIEFSKQLSVAV